MAFINHLRKRPQGCMCVYACFCLHSHASSYLCILHMFGAKRSRGGTQATCALSPHVQLLRRHAAVRMLQTIPKHIRNDDKTREATHRGCCDTPPAGPKHTGSVELNSALVKDAPACFMTLPPAANEYIYMSSKRVSGPGICCQGLSIKLFAIPLL